MFLYSEMDSPSSSGLALVIPFIISTGPCIIHLLQVSGPFAVLGRVTEIIINTFEGILDGWAWSHIGKEVLEVVPALAYSNAAFAVVLIGYSMWIFAALVHGLKG